MNTKDKKFNFDQFSMVTTLTEDQQIKVVGGDIIGSVIIAEDREDVD